MELALLLFGWTLWKRVHAGETAARFETALPGMRRLGASSEITFKRIDHHLFKAGLAQYLFDRDIAGQLIGDIKRNLFAFFGHSVLYLNIRYAQKTIHARVTHFQATLVQRSLNMLGPNTSQNANAIASWKNIAAVCNRTSLAQSRISQTMMEAF
jgi:hypothetical protein